MDIKVARHIGSNQIGRTAIYIEKDRIIFVNLTRNIQTERKLHHECSSFMFDFSDVRTYHLLIVNNTNREIYIYLKSIGAISLTIQKFNYIDMERSTFDYLYIERATLIKLKNCHGEEVYGCYIEKIISSDTNIDEIWIKRIDSIQTNKLKLSSFNVLWVDVIHHMTTPKDYFIDSIINFQIASYGEYQNVDYIHNHFTDDMIAFFYHE